MGTFPIMLLLMQWTRFQVSFQAYENLESLDWSRSTISEVGHFTPAFISTFFSHHQFNMDHLSNLAANDSYTMGKGVRNMQIMYSQIFFAIHAFVEEFLWKQRAWGPSSNASLKISKKGDQWALTIVNRTHMWHMGELLESNVFLLYKSF